MGFFPYTGLIMNMKKNVSISLIAAVVYVLTYLFIQGYFNREISTAEVFIGGITFFLAFLAAHVLVSRLQNK